MKFPRPLKISRKSVKAAYKTYLTLRRAFLYNQATAGQVNQAKEVWERACTQLLNPK